jgi:hypothetical protein
VPPVVACDVAPAQGLHGQAQAVVGAGGGQQVEVIVGQGVGVHGHTVRPHGLAQGIEQGLAVGVVTGQALAIVHTLHQEVRPAGQAQARESRHGGSRKAPERGG